MKLSEDSEKMVPCQYYQPDCNLIQRYQSIYLVTEAVTIAATMRMTAMNVAIIRLWAWWTKK